MQGRKTLGQEKRKELSPEKKELQKKMASCKMVIKFHDANTWSKWSNEYAQPRIVNISDGVNEMFRIFEKYFRRSTHSAAIFDTRESKEIGAHNKIYQFEKGVWTMVQPFHW
jgi:hypothetical protein